MSGLLRRIRGARPAADPAPVEGAAWNEQGDATHHHDAAGDGGVPAVDAEDATRELPAGVDLDAYVGDRPTTRRRGPLRRRARHLRRVREVLLRDLGGIVFEIHRSGAAGSEAQSRLVAQKLARLAELDSELRELEDILGERRAMVLREPGIGGSCPECGELFGSDARFCWACGTPVAPGAARPLTETVPADLPAIGAAAHEGVPTHVWTEPAVADEPPHAPANAAEATTTEQPHIDGTGEELRS